jgi:3-oxoacyl-[acyl-carrier-protein] synthase II
MKDRVVITGTGLVSALGLSAAETWQGILSLKSGINPIHDFDVQGFDCTAAVQVYGVGAAELDIHPRDSRIMDKHSYMLMKGSRDAFSEAKLDDSEIPPEDIGYFAGMGMVDYNVEDLLPSVLQSLDEKGNLDYDKFYSHAFQQIHPLWPLSMLNNINFCQVAIDLGIKGDNTTFCPHADSGMHSIIEAYNTLIEEKAKVVLAGGVSEKVSPLSLARAQWFNILNTSDHTCRPFGRDRNGTILGEGCGIISLELQSSAAARDVTSLAAVTGYGTSFEASEESNCPTSKAVSIAMEQAIAKAGLHPCDIDLIIAHGDGTAVGDRNETEAIHRTFSKCLDKVIVFSSKGALGHLLAGAPAVDAVLGIHILKDGIIPATYNTSPIDDSIKFRVINGEPLKTDPKRILINALSYEGQCASLIIESIDN